MWGSAGVHFRPPAVPYIYINDLQYISLNVFTIQFADDTSVFIKGKNSEAIAHLRTSLRYNPNQINAKYKLGYILLKKQY